MAVNRAPASIPNIGFENIVNIPVNSGTSASGFTAPLIVSIPNINTENPINMAPTSLRLSCPPLIIRIMPTSASTGVKEDGFSRRIKKFWLSIPVRLSSHEVSVVPILAPIITLTACERVIRPEFTNPTTITVVAEDDCMTAVTPAPRSTAFKRLSVRRSNIRSRRPPDILVSPSPIICIPYRKKDRPPINEIA